MLNKLMQIIAHIQSRVRHVMSTYLRGAKTTFNWIKNSVIILKFLQLIKPYLLFILKLFK